MRRPSYQQGTQYSYRRGSIRTSETWETEGRSTVSLWWLQVLNGVSLGMLLFLLAAGLSLIFGMMKIVNLSHGSYYLLGAYVGLSMWRATGSFILALVGAVVVVGFVGGVMYRFFLSRLQQNELAQVLCTFGFFLMIGDAALWGWGGVPQILPRPTFLTSSVAVGSMSFPSYRLFVIAVGAVAAILLWMFQEKTRIGAFVRAAIDDEEMVRGIGVNTSVLSLAVFMFGAALAAFGGVIGGPFVGVYPGADMEVLLLVLVVLIVGGLGSFPGALLGSLIVGLIDTFGKALFPELSMFFVYAPMVLVLAFRPSGLLGRV